MKIKGLRWWIIGLIMLITIINYLDRGTLNYMWVANVEFPIVEKIDATSKKNQAQLVEENNHYMLLNKNGQEVIVEKEKIYIKEKNSIQIAVKREGIAYDLGFLDDNKSIEENEKTAKDILGLITIFFMIAYGISQLVSGKLSNCSK